MRRLLIAAGLLAAPAGAQDMGHMHMPGMTMPMPMPAAKPAPRRKAQAPARTKAAPAPRTAAPRTPPAAGSAPPMAGMSDHAMGAMPGMDHPGTPATPGAGSPAMPMTMPMDHAGMAQGAMDGAMPMGHSMTDHGGMTHGSPPPPPVGDAPPPSLPVTWAADATYGTAAMAEARHRMMREEGGRNFYQILFNVAEVQARRGQDGFRWDGEGWFGGDLDRLAVRTEGEGSTRGDVDAAELQLLWSRAIGRYANLQAGIRQDFGRGPHRTYATIAAETILPYQFEVEGRLFLSTRGELRARAEGWYDQRITQRLVLQPRVELNLAAQSRAATGVGAGLTQAEAGLRLRYEFAREFAPYLGISYEAETGRTATFSRAAGRDPTHTSLVAGVRFWF